ncbi:MAG TPA: glycosyltransferase [Acidimicrobiia bacterium]|nr:glycosyltransferase [Acidimicrobiia bacterium]
MAAVVLCSEEMQLAATLNALDRQVYKPLSVVVVGEPEVGEGEVPTYTKVANVKEVLAALPSETSFVWWLHADTQPRPDALRALVEEATRHDAGVAGSKVLITGADDRLGSVGAATDAFGEPYSGLDPGELDLEQYDVVREVAFVSPVSMLIRRDLLRGLGGLDASLPAQAAGLDLSQRARLAGAKVLVVPSSEVFHAAECPADRPGWRQLAGRYRAMLVAYQPVTLAWVLPVGLVVAVADSAGQMLLGRFRPIVSYLAAWLWNLAHLPTIWSIRRGTRRIRQSGDEELFRFQVGGSVRVRETAAELGERLSTAFDTDEEESISERARVLWKRPSVLLTLAGIAALLIGTRTLWLSGLPQSGFALVPAEDPWPALNAWAGGWNASGLGTPNPPPPLVALGAAATLLTGGRPGLAATLLTLLALIGGFWGMIRLCRRQGLSFGAGFLAGFVYLGGSASGALFGGGQWPLLLAAGPLPWAIEAAIAPPPGDGRRATGLLARGGLAASLTAIAFPPALGVVLVGAALLTAMRGRWRNLWRTVGIFVLGAVGVAPWVIGGEVMALLEAAPVPEIQPGWWWPVSVALAALAVASSVRVGNLSVAGFGCIAASGGWLLGFLPVLPAGLGLAGLLGAALGSGLVVATLFGAGERRWQKVLAAGGMVLLLVPAVLTVGRGRAGLPPDQWSRRLDFVGAISGEGTAGRVLIIGSPGELPGATRAAGSIVYRTVDGVRPTLEQAYLPGPRSGDRALQQALAQVAAASSLRPGSVLGEFAISWVVVLPGAITLDDAIDRQVDLAPLLIEANLRPFANRSPTPRAVTDGGTEWQWNGRFYQGPAQSGRLRLADNADPGWGPGWVMEGWANSVSADSGRATFARNSLLLASAVGGGLSVLVMAVLAWWGRRDRAVSTRRPARAEPA